MSITAASAIYPVHGAAHYKYLSSLLLVTSKICFFPISFMSIYSVCLHTYTNKQFVAERKLKIKEDQ